MTKSATPKIDTRTRMIQAAFDLFHQQGVNATSVDEILAKSGTGKSQFYHYFKSKEDLVHAVVESFGEMLKAQKLPLKYEIDSWADLEEWFGVFVNHQRRSGCSRGCPMATIAYELTGDDELIRQDINMICELSRKPLLKFFVTEQARGHLVDGADPEALTDFCYTIMQGGLILSKIQKDAAGFERSVEHAITYLKTLRKVSEIDR